MEWPRDLWEKTSNIWLKGGRKKGSRFRVWCKDKEHLLPKKQYRHFFFGSICSKTGEKGTDPEVGKARYGKRGSQAGEKMTGDNGAIRTRSPVVPKKLQTSGETIHREREGVLKGDRDKGVVIPVG